MSECVWLHMHVCVCMHVCAYASNFPAVFLSCWEGQTCSSGSSLQESDSLLCQRSSGKSVYHGTLSFTHTQLTTKFYK